MSSGSRESTRRTALRRGLALALAASGCTFHPPVPGGGGDDETPGRCEWELQPAYVDPCAGPPPGAALFLNSPGTYTLDADAATLEGPQAPIEIATSEQRGALVVWTSELEVAQEATLRLEGARPVIVVAEDGIRIFGKVDAASLREPDDDEGFLAGAGADPASCHPTPPGAGNGMPCGDGATGGGGGGFGAAGAPGGIGGLTRNCGLIPAGGVGGLMQPLPDDLRGGCPGGNGAAGNGASTDAGQGGAGGGAVGLVARRSIAISGTIHAGGAGGRPGVAKRASGGGGGAGGMIALEAPSIEVRTGAVVAANGGGGGGGCKGAPAEPGADAVARAEPARGGNGEGGPGSDAGGAGGDGGYESMPAVGGKSAERGGGGGGGAVGIIFVNSPSFSESGTVSPPARLKAP